MNDIDAVTAARTAAEAIRHLNHATITKHGYQWPSDIDAVITELHLNAAGMSQALDQARNWLHRAHLAGTVGHDQHPSDDDVTANTVGDAADQLTNASADARQLAATLERLREVTAHLTGTSAKYVPGTPELPQVRR